MTTDPIRDWAERYQGELDAERSERALAAQKARLLLVVARERQPSRVNAWWLSFAVGLAAVCAAGAWFAFVLPNAEESISAGNTELAVGRVLSSGPSVQHVAFSGGSAAELAANSRVRLEQNSPARIEWRVLDGKMSFDVERREGREWWIWAGETRVRVLGTAFAVDYASRDGAVRVRVQRGRVEVKPEGATPFVLGAGEEYVAPHALEPAAGAPTAASSGAAARGAVVEPAVVDPAAAIEVEHAPSGAPGSSARTADWQALVRSGEYEAALGIVRSVGLDRVLARASAQDLLLLGNAARFRADYGLAERIYLHVRTVGEPNPQALAAYYLARIALDGRQSPAQATRWLRTYVAEAPRGELSAAARGRLMDLLERSGDVGGARAVAVEYLALHPSGPDAGLAERLVRAKSK